MSHRQSCDRCRQQKVRCLRGEGPREKNIDLPLSPKQAQLPRCERCAKASVECVYSFTRVALKSRSERRSVAKSMQKDTDAGLVDFSGSTTWFEHDVSGALYADGTLQTGGPTLAPLSADYGGLTSPFAGGGAAMSFSDWNPNIQPTSLANPTSLPPAPCTVDSCEDSEDIDVDKHFNDALSLQLTSLSQQAAQAVRYLTRSNQGRTPLTVSSPQVNVALEATNTLTSIISNVTASHRNDDRLDPTTTNIGLAFSALASHQQILALFRAICDDIHSCLQSKTVYKHHNRQRSNSGQPCDVGPSSVAQFVMVLQLLMHLINRMDRSLFQNGLSIRHDSMSSGYITPVTPGIMSPFTIDPLQTELSSGASSPQFGLLVLVQDVVGTVDNEHEKLRQSIQQLQAEMELTGLH
ncbi:hypothetical protein HBI56_226420 [Parastagonospora nodorum]|nr:hypothetical protein HBH69_215800 [Parastagonospora nodorum]KAH5168924.1 hypothetical protein HBH77_233470 [Parastagonospora nodorum]KAH6479134.1 hypothetical protein HBI56_226420 [Parastagonospora nodorum]